MLDIPQLHKDILALDDADAAVRRQAFQSLRHHDEKEWAAVPNEVSQTLVTALKEQLLNGMKQPSAQKEAATILGNMGSCSKSALPQLLELLREGVPDPVREAVVIALSKIGKEAKVAVGQIVQLLANSRPALSAQAIRALGNIGCADQRVRAALANLWLSPIQFQGGQVQVAITLCKLQIDANGLLPLLTRNLVANSDTSLRKAAAEALTWCNKNETDVVPALLTASLSDTNEEVRLMAQAGLDQMSLPHEKAVQLCAKQLKESSYAEAALRKSGPLAVPVLIKSLASEDPAIRAKAARILGSLGEVAAKAAPALTEALQDTDPDVRLAVGKGLWSISKQADVVVPPLVELLTLMGAADADAGETRRRFLQTVMEALSRIGPPATAAIAALTALTKDTNRHIRESALSALQEISPTAANKPGARR